MRLFGFGLGLAAFAGFGVYAARMLRGQDLSRYLTPTALSGIVLCSLFYMLVIPIGALAWRCLLKDFGVNQSWRSLTQIMSVTQMAKYVPGNFGHHLGRVGMALARDIALSPVIVSIAVETLLAILAAVFIGVGSTWLSHVSGSALSQKYLVAVVLIAFVAVLLVAILTLGRNVLAQFIQRFLPAKVPSSSALTMPRLKSIILVFAAYCLVFTVVGGGITVMAVLLLPNIPHSGLLLTGSFATAWAIGFLVVGAPAGLGAREGIMLAMLQSGYSQNNAIILIIAIRLATTLGDVLCFFVGAVLSVHSRRSISRASLDDQLRTN